MPYSYLVFGAGRQGTAAAYDLARFGEADRITLADRDLPTAQRAAERVNQLTSTNIAAPLALEVTDTQAVAMALQDVDAALSAVPYYFNLSLTQAAITAGAHFCDLGGNTKIVRAQLALNSPRSYRYPICPTTSPAKTPPTCSSTPKIL